MKNKPVVAIMMPVYNGEKTLMLALKSLIAQTYKNWVCYIVNDGSTDSTKDILESLQDPRFVVINFEKNKGRAIARQTSLEAAEGKYIAFLDADDFFHPSKLEKQVNLLEKYYEIDLVSCGNLCYGNNYEAMSFRGMGDNVVEDYSKNKKLNLALRTSLLRLDKCKEVSFRSDLKLAEDTDFLEKYLPNRKYLIQDEILYYYSEFDSVDKRKILNTDFYSFMQYKSMLLEQPIYAVKNMIKTCIKIGCKLFLYPFVDVNFYLKRRGDKPEKKHVDEFNLIVKKLLV